ncbi:MAG: hypothetical protein WCK96_16090 [Methylococcales bacterium]
MSSQFLKKVEQFLDDCLIVIRQTSATGYTPPFANKLCRHCDALALYSPIVIRGNHHANFSP